MGKETKVAANENTTEWLLDQLEAIHAQAIKLIKEHKALLKVT
ncbi:MAG TPA: hypothetical protein VN939_12385 [Chthoniobacterales bacterium]|jgi:hypothetical protein|nr:hypothetical protein [Chthoniobacterales bacterium]